MGSSSEKVAFSGKRYILIMKIVLFVLGVLAFAQGLVLEDGSAMEVEFDDEEESAGAACIADPRCDNPSPRNFCQGNVEIRSKLNDVEKSHGNLAKGEGEAAPYKISKMIYTPRMEKGSTRTIEVNGNCCWKFYEKRYYRGTMKMIRNSGAFTSSFTPRSLKIVEC